MAGNRSLFMFVLVLIAPFFPGSCQSSAPRSLGHTAHNSSSSRSLSTTEIVLGFFGPITSVSPNYVSCAVAFDLDFRKNFESDLVTRFGPPIVKIANLNPNLRIKLQIGTSNSDVEVGVATALDMFQGSNGLDAIAGYVGGYHSAISMPVANLAAVMKVPQVSWASTSPKLSNKAQYPYFLRTVPPDSIQGAAMWQFIDQWKVPSCSYLYALEPYGEGLYSAVANNAAMVNQAFRVNGIGLLYMPGSYDIEKARPKIKLMKEAGHKFIYFGLTADQATQLFFVMEEEGVYENPGYQFLGGEGVFISDQKYMPTSKKFPMGFFKFDPINRGPLFPKFNEMWNKMMADDVLGADATTRYSLDKLRVALGAGPAAAPSDDIFQSEVKLYETFLFDACYTFAVAFSNLMNAGKTGPEIKGELLLNEIKKTDFEGITGVVGFNADGDRLAAYTIRNFQPTDENPEGKLTLVATFSAITSLITLEPGSEILWMSGDRGESLPQSLIACLPGFFEDATTRMCRACNMGEYQDEGSKKRCKRCRSGTFADAYGSTACMDCPIGKMAASVIGSRECKLCGNGTFTDTTGNSECNSCGVGRFADGQGASACDSCGKSGLTTMHKVSVEGQEQWVLLSGAKTADSCGCKAGSRPISGSGKTTSCTPCTTGLLCQGGNADVAITQGYFTRKTDPYYVYLCSPEELCPGGKPGSCLGARTNFLCTKCEGDSITEDVDEDTDFSSAEAGCQPCTVNRSLTLVLALIAALALLLFELHEAKQSPLEESPLLIEMKNVCGQAVMFLQILGAIQSANVDFSDPFANFIDSICTPVELEYFLKALPCVSAKFDDAVTVFAGSLFLPVVFLLLITTCFFIINLIKPKFLMSDGLLNVFGETLIEFYVSLTLAVLNPFRCYKHPNEGDKSMSSNPEILCSSDNDDYSVLIVLSVVGMLIYTINAMVVTYAAVWYHPKAMANNDIGFLIRCHFLFNRWTPKAYWFTAVAVTRNAFVAIWPMMLEDFAVSLSFMVVTLLIPAGGALVVMPRRTPAMNALNTHIDFVQILILVCGPLMMLSEDGKNTFLSWICLLFLVSVAVITVLLVCVKAAQWISKSRTPLSWAFDISLDHHAGPGGSTARALHLVLSDCCRKGKLFYDVDSYTQRQSVGVIMDAAKLSKHLCVCLSSETWSRDWCVAAITSACQWKVEMSCVTFTEAAGDSQSSEKRTTLLISALKGGTDVDEACQQLAKKTPRHLLRPHGLADESIPKAMKVVFQCQPNDFLMISKTPTETAVSKLFAQMLSVPLIGQGVSPKFFGPEPSGISSAICLSCDHADPEAVTVSRLFGYLLSECMAEAKAMTAISTTRADGITMNSAKVAALAGQIAKLSLVQDIDLDPPTFARMVKEDKLPAVVAVLTGNSFKSVSQLLRLGYHQRYNSAGFRPHPLAVSEVFSMPEPKTLRELESGKGLALGSNPKEAIEAFLTDRLSFRRIVLAVMQVVEARVFLCNCPLLREPDIKEVLLCQLIGLSESVLTAAKPVPEPDLAEEVVGAKEVPIQDHLYMDKYISLSDAKGSSSIGNVSEEVMC